MAAVFLTLRNSRMVTMSLSPRTMPHVSVTAMEFQMDLRMPTTTATLTMTIAMMTAFQISSTPMFALSLLIL